jgi:hypothetical protein
VLCACVQIEERFSELKGLVETRKARSRQRSSYGQLCESLPYYCYMTQCMYPYILPYTHQALLA